MAPAFTFIWAVVEPLVSMVYQLGWFIVDKLKYFVVPLQRMIWDPLVRVASALYSTFGPSFGWIYSTFIAPFVGIIFRVLFALFTPFYEVGKLIVQKFAGTLLQPVWAILQKIGVAVLQFFANNYQKIIGNIWGAIQPMLNIRGFFSRLFGPLITGLKAVLHWFMPESVIRIMDRIAVAIFGRDPKNGQDLTTEETALIVLFISIMAVYVSVISGGYAVKIALVCLYVFDGALSNRLYDLLSLFSDDDSADIPMTFSWILPDFWHHQIGMLAFFVTVTIVVVFRFVRFLIWAAPIVVRLVYNGLRNTNWRRPFAKQPSAPSAAGLKSPSGPATMPSVISSPAPLAHSVTADMSRPLSSPKPPSFRTSSGANMVIGSPRQQILSRSTPSSPSHRTPAFQQPRSSPMHQSTATSPGY